MKRAGWTILGLLIAVAFAAEKFLTGGTSHATPRWKSIPGFFVLFGFIGSLALAGLAKALGKLLVEKKEDYYDSR